MSDRRPFLAHRRTINSVSRTLKKIVRPFSLRRYGRQEQANVECQRLSSGFLTQKCANVVMKHLGQVTSIYVFAYTAMKARHTFGCANIKLPERISTVAYSASPRLFPTAVLYSREDELKNGTCGESAPGLLLRMLWANTLALKFSTKIGQMPVPSAPQRCSLAEHCLTDSPAADIFPAQRRS